MEIREEMIANRFEFLKTRREIKIAKTLSLIVGTFLLLWSPAMLLYLVMALTKNREIPPIFFSILKRLIELNAAVDPFIYAYRTRNIREALKRLFACNKLRESVSDESNPNTASSRKTSLYVVSSELSKCQKV
jgi:hypothetical protein